MPAKAVARKPARPARHTPQKPTVADLLRAKMERERKLCAKAPVVPPTEKLTPITKATPRVGYSVWALRHMAADGRLNYRRIGRRIFITESEIARLAGSELQAVNA